MNERAEWNWSGNNSFGIWLNINKQAIRSRTVFFSFSLITCDVIDRRVRNLECIQHSSLIKFNSCVSLWPTHTFKWLNLSWRSVGNRIAKRRIKWYWVSNAGNSWHFFRIVWCICTTVFDGRKRAKKEESTKKKSKTFYVRDFYAFLTVRRIYIYVTWEQKSIFFFAEKNPSVHFFLHDHNFCRRKEFFSFSISSFRKQHFIQLKQWKTAATKAATINFVVRVNVK